MEQTVWPWSFLLHCPFLSSFQAWGRAWIRSVWDCVQGGVAVLHWRGGSGSEDPERRIKGGGQDQVPPGGGHHGTVQSSQRGQDVRSGHHRRTSEFESLVVEK